MMENGQYPDLLDHISANSNDNSRLTGLISGWRVDANGLETGLTWQGARLEWLEANNARISTQIAFIF